jgi:epoxyqueuosine reductase QueG
LQGTEAPSLVELMGMSSEEWELWTRGSAIRRAGCAGFKRHVVVALGSPGPVPSHHLALVHQRAPQHGHRRLRPRVLGGDPPDTGGDAVM